MNIFTILVVDDQPEYLKTYATFFFEEKVPYKIISAVDGKLAIELAMKEMPDVIIMDWQMPVMDGLMALKEIKKNPDLCDIPVIIASGIMMSNEDLQTALEAGASDYIRKPLDKIELIARVNSHIKIAKYIKTIKEKDLTINKERDDRIEIMSESVHSASQQINEIILFFDTVQRNMISEISGLKQAGISENEILKIVIQKLTKNQKTYRHYLTLNELHAQEERFIKTLLKKHPALLPAEVGLCLLLKKNIPSKEIASLTFRSPNTIKVARSRLRKKLRLGKGNIYNYLNSI